MRGAGRSRFKKYCKERARRRGTNVRRGSPYDGARPSQCLKCDRGQHRRCARLPHCWARFRSPNGIRRRDLNRAANRAARAAANRHRAPPARRAPSYPGPRPALLTCFPCVISDADNEGEGEGEDEGEDENEGEDDDDDDGLDGQPGASGGRREEEDDGPSGEPA